MNTIKHLVFIALLAVVPCAVGAQNTETVTPSAVRVATVNVRDVAVVAQDNNALTVTFNISNREGVQPHVLYAINLLQRTETDTMALVDQKVYRVDTFTLQPGEVKQVKVTYLAPEYLSGSYSIEVEARNPDGLRFGASRAKTPIALEGTDEFLFVDASACYLTVEGDTEHTPYHPLQGVDITRDENLVAHCALESMFQSDVTLVPILRTYYRSVFGKLESTKLQEPVTIRAQEKVDYTVVLPKSDTAQAYDAVLTFVHEERNDVSLSSPLVFHYVLQGESATIQNVTLDKDSFSAGETATLHFTWSGSAGNFPGARHGRVESEGMVARITLSNDQNTACAEEVSHPLSMQKQTGVEELSIPVNTACMNPIAKVAIVSGGGTILAENSYAVMTESVPPQATTTPDTERKTGIALGILVLLVLTIGIVVYTLRKKHPPVAPLAVFVACAGLSMFFGAADVSADTWNITVAEPAHPTHTTEIMMDISLDKDEYAPGETIEAQGAVVYAVCSNGANQYASLMMSLTLDATINGRVGNVKNRTNADFNAQNVVGLYTALFDLTGQVHLGADWIVFAASTTIPYTVRLAPVEATSTGPTCGGTAERARSVTVTGKNGAGQAVFGSGPYTTDSYIPKAAVHAGLLAVGETGEIMIKPAGCVNGFVASTRNAVRTFTYNLPYQAMTLSGEGGSSATYSCKNLPLNAISWGPGEMVGLGTTTNWVYAEYDTYAYKCEYYCASGYAYNATTKKCDAVVTPNVAGVCGVADGTTSTTTMARPADSALCSKGLGSWTDPDATDGVWNWDCVGTISTQSCLAFKYPSCTLNSINPLATVVNFEKRVLWGIAAGSVSARRTVSLPAGDYRISIMTYDGYKSRVTTSPVQSTEQVKIRFYDASNTQVAQSAYTSDIPDGVMRATVAGVVNERLTLPSAVVSVEPMNNGIVGNPQSVYPICALIEPLTAVAPVLAPQ